MVRGVPAAPRRDALNPLVVVHRHVPLTFSLQENYMLFFFKSPIIFFLECNRWPWFFLKSHLIGPWSILSFGDACSIPHIIISIAMLICLKIKWQFVRCWGQWAPGYRQSPCCMYLMLLWGFTCNSQSRSLITFFSDSIPQSLHSDPLTICLTTLSDFLGYLTAFRNHPLTKQSHPYHPLTLFRFTKRNQ